MRKPAAAVVSAVLLWSGAAASQRGPAMQQLLDGATAHVEALVGTLSRVVAEEQYVQELLLTHPEGSRGSFPGSPKVVERRRLSADFLLVNLPGSNEWQMFRDVFEVDGRPVRGREDRLTQLFLEPSASASALQRAREIAAESARFNIREIGTVDNPLLALAFLQRSLRERFRFTMRGRDKDAGADVWTLEFRETARPTIIRTAADRDIFARGRYGIDAGTGRVVTTEVSFAALGTETAIATTFGFDERLGLSVPVEMRFRRGARANEVRGVATYARFRRFEVGTSETIQPR